MTRSDNKPRQIREGDIVPLEYFVQRARTSLDYVRGANVTINRDEVPPTLQHLIPFVERWAIPGSGPQMAFIEHLQENSPEEIDAFCRAFKPFVDEISAWNRESLTGVNAQNINDRPQAVFQFVYALGVYSLVKPVDSDVVAKQRERDAAAQRTEARKRALCESEAAFRARRFEEVVRLLEPFETDLAGGELMRLEIARKRQS